MALNIKRGKVQKAQKVIVYGPEGIGKTSFAAQFPDPLFIDTEGSTEHYGVARTERPMSWSALMAQVAAVKAERPCSTLVIDTADWAERLCMEHVCKANGWESIEMPGYGRGYNQTVEEFCKLLDALTGVAESGVNVVLTAHAVISKFEQPDEAASYDRWTLALVDGKKASSAAKVKEWADAVLFADYKTIVEVVGDGKAAKGKAKGAQRRVMHAQHHACWDAKNRWGLPEEVPFDFAQIAAHIPAGRALTAEEPDTAVSGRTKPLRSIVYAKDGTVVSDTASPAPAWPKAPESWAPVAQLMAADAVTVDEVMAMVQRKGFFPAGTMPEALPPDFIGFLSSNWPKCRADILGNRVPFN